MAGPRRCQTAPVVGVTREGPGTSGVRALELAADLAGVASLSDAIERTLPVLAAEAGADVVIFAVAGSEASGARGWPRDADWSEAFEDGLRGLWDSGPLTQHSRSVGVVPPFELDAMMHAIGWAALPLRLPGDARPLRFAVYLAVSAENGVVSGYILGRADRAFSPDELTALAHLQTAVVAAHGRFLRTSGGAPGLTPRQREILHLLHQGLTAGAIASRLGISGSTVGKHLRDLYARLETHDRVSTVREAQVRGLLDGVAGEPWQDVRLP